jgi:hypothetical protein
MKKLRLFFFVLFIINFSEVIEIDQRIYEGIYDKAILIVKGMTDDSDPLKEPLCYNTLKNGKDKFLPIFLGIIDKCKNGIDYTCLWSIIPAFEDDFLNDCKVYDIVTALVSYIPFDSKNNKIRLIRDIGNNTQINKQLFFEGSSNFVKVRGIDGKLVLVGKVFSAMLNFKFD